MFDFLRRPGPRSPSGAILRALRADTLSSAMDVDALGVVESRGTYSGRRVTFFRIVDPKRAAGQAADVFEKLAYRDLDAHPELVLRSGHVERDGTVVLARVPESGDAAAAVREGADRSRHADDEGVVFPDRGRTGERGGAGS